MPPDSESKPARSGLSLYANLLDSATKDTAAGTISSAPVVYQQSQANETHHDPSQADKQQISSAALRFQPTKRPQLSSQRAKSKTTAQRQPPPPPPPATSVDDANPDPLGATTRAPAKTTLADWTADGGDNDVNGFYTGEKRQRGGKKKRKRNKEPTRITQNWDDIYDPSRPNVYEEYKNSDEKILEIREWKDRLYAHRMARHRSSESDSDSDGRNRTTMNKSFVPPSGLSFAPPRSFNEPAPLPPSSPPPPPPEPVEVPNDATGEDAFARRVRLSQQASQPSLPFQLPEAAVNNQPPPPAFPPSRPPPPTLPLTPSNYPPSAPISSSAQTNISRAPVRYNLPAPPPELPSSEAELSTALQQESEAPDPPPTDEDAPRSLRPGQKGFAERLMSKYGWSKGSGLGASGSGITAPLRVQLEKQKKRPDSEGGGFVGSGGMGKIIGGKKRSGAEGVQEGKYGAMSEVVVLRGMVDGMNLDEEMGAGDGGLLQEIGQECGEKYGRVERVYIDRSSPGSPPVFVKFTSQLSALRAVNALEGRIFNGNTITARYFDTDKFEQGIFDQ